MKKILLLFAAFILLLSASCAKEKEKPKPPPLPVLKVAVDPIKVQLLEQENLNIPYWAENGAKDRTLVHISATEGLSTLDENVVGSIKEKITKGGLDGLKKTEKPEYTSLNTVFLAVKLGLVRDVVWVIPALESITHGDVGGIKDYLKKNYPDQSKDIELLHLDGKVVEGRINGVPLKIVSLQNVPKIDEPVLLNIDLSFFSQLYLNEKDTRILSLVSNFVKTLQESGLSSDMVTVSASNNDGLVPYKFRCLAGYFAEIFADPKILEGAPPKLWAERADAWKIEQRSYKEAIPLYMNLLKEFPRDAATHYDLSNAYFETGNYTKSISELDNAVNLDSGYKAASARYVQLLDLKGHKEISALYVRASQDK